MILKQLGRVDRHENVQGDAMTVDPVRNIGLVFLSDSTLVPLRLQLGILAAGNFGYVESRTIVLSGFLLLRRDRPD
jgi:hypothetical protein